jgi:hypothetical protein
MDSHYETIKTPATAESVFGVIQEVYRQSWELEHECEPEVVLTIDSTIKECRDAFELVDWNPFNQSLNELFEIQFDKGEWKTLLEPASEKTFRGICERISKEVFQELIKPVNILGKTCLKGGIFLTIRSKLAKAGASVEELSPSSELAPYAKNHLGVFLEISSKLFPGKFPIVMIHNPISDFAFGGFVVSMLLTILGGIIEHFIDPAGAFLTVFGVLGVIISSLVAPFVVGSSSKSVEFGNLKTFRDLVNYISEPQASGS